jgi:hypothetical protein
MCSQKYYSIMKSKNRRFMLKNAENNAHTEVIEANLKNNSEKLLKHQNSVPTRTICCVTFFAFPATAGQKNVSDTRNIANRAKIDLAFSRPQTVPIFILFEALVRYC